MGYGCITKKSFILSLTGNLMVNTYKYSNIALPNDLVEKIDSIITHSKMGYKTRGEFVKEAVRILLKEISK